MGGLFSRVVIFGLNLLLLLSWPLDRLLGRFLFLRQVVPELSQFREACPPLSRMSPARACSKYILARRRYVSTFVITEPQAPHLLRQLRQSELVPASLRRRPHFSRPRCSQGEPL